jgi:hypothetical protein
MREAWRSATLAALSLDLAPSVQPELFLTGTTGTRTNSALLIQQFVRATFLLIPDGWAASAPIRPVITEQASFDVTLTRGHYHLLLHLSSDEASKAGLKL